MNTTITKRSIATNLEFSLLERLLNQTADDVSNCLKLLKKKLRKHDSRNLPGFHYRSTCKYCLKVDIRVVKEMISEMRQVAKRVSQNKIPTQSDINAARITANGTADALNDLVKAGRTYDQNRGRTDNEVQDKMAEGEGSREKAETVEALVKSTLRDNFMGFEALETQIAVVEKALLPW
ncbi:hypothetical protein GN958_ATG12626 [Phytophthora infestans]|uniref:Uncharacterized protein n=1 Tax=Phytophthora infestans TaxID=4787 RepID=A0A8S9UBS8_PHYIN|nr:hypothetical protein GN958_ATG12626 [Phytophthora infestans]